MVVQEHKEGVKEESCDGSKCILRRGSWIFYCSKEIIGMKETGVIKANLNYSSTGKGMHSYTTITSK